MNFKSLHSVAQFGLMAVVIGLLFTVAACSSDSSDDLSDSERFVGAWELVDVTDAVGNKLATFNARFTSFEVSFLSTGNASFSVDITDPAETDIVLSGTYAVNEVQKTITVTVNPGVEVELEFDFAFDSDERVAVSTNSTLLNLAFGTSLAGDATITLERS